MTQPSTRLPGRVLMVAFPTGELPAAAVGEWQDMRPPDDAQPTSIRIDIVGAGPGVLRLRRRTANGTLLERLVNVPAVPDPEGYTFVIDYPVAAAWRMTYDNNGPDVVLATCEWAYTSPGRR